MEKKIIKYLEDFDVYKNYPIGFLNSITHIERMQIEHKIRMLFINEKANEISTKFNISFESAKNIIIKDSFFNE